MYMWASMGRSGFAPPKNGGTRSIGEAHLNIGLDIAIEIVAALAVAALGGSWVAFRAGARAKAKVGDRVMVVVKTIIRLSRADNSDPESEPQRQRYFAQFLVEQLDAEVIGLGAQLNKTQAERLQDFVSAVQSFVAKDEFTQRKRKTYWQAFRKVLEAAAAVLRSLSLFGLKYRSDIAELHKQIARYEELSD